jgi:hypothetical protein
LHHDNYIINIRRKLLVLLVSLFLFNTTSEAQWISNPEKNTLLVTNCFNPVNISSVEDGMGGLFIFWEDNKTGFQGEVNFLHVNSDGIVSFRTDGKKISSAETPKYNPAALPGESGTAYILWRERLGYSDQIYVQKVSSSGALLWKQDGISLSTSGKMISDFSASSDKAGNIFSAFVNGEPDEKGEYVIKLQGVNKSGGRLFTQEITAAASENKKSSITVTSNDSGGVQIFWLESVEHKSVLMGQSIDKAGKLKWGRKPVVFSDPLENIFSFSAKRFNSSVYLVWQLQKSDKDLYHQLAGSNGNELWKKYGQPVIPLRGNQTNPQILIMDKDILLTWTDDSFGDRNIHAQKFNSKGEAQWSRNGINITDYKGDQFGQKILSDGNNGAIITWLDRRVNAVRGNIYAQRIDKDGNLLWDSLGIEAASSKNTEKSYISVIQDDAGGAVVVFKEKRNGKNEIFGHKIYNTGTFTSQIIAFNTELLGDSVKVSWYSANELNESNFTVERTLTDYDGEWTRVAEINSEGRAAAKYYEYYDKPDTAGTIFYRVVQSDQNGNIQPSELSKINYLRDAAAVFVAQNAPNPFKEATKISIYLPRAGKVKIEFFDSRIEKINELTEDYPSGTSEIEFSAAGLEPGIYFYKVHIGDYVDVKKMVVVN